MSPSSRVAGLAALLLAAISGADLLLAEGGEGGKAEPWPEGEGGGRTQAAEGTLTVLHRFSGVVDDGRQGLPDRKHATSIHCTNFSSVSASVEVQVYQFDGSLVATGSASIGPRNTYTFSTQKTSVYFDDIILGGSPGTPMIDQGSGIVLSASREVRCTAQVLDPLGDPPVFVSRIRLPGFRIFADDFESGDTSRWSVSVP